MQKKFSKKLNVQLVAEVFSSFGIEHIVLSPGSRNGALATHFSHHPKFKTYSIVDERCAGFVALGMAQQIRKPVVICCTSGSAAANYYPAVTEAFYQNCPIIVLTADRPEHLIDNFDGQTIRQKNLYENHAYFSTQLSELESTEALASNLNLSKNAVATCILHSGPVHINMPFSEPLYEFQPTIDISFEEFKVSEKNQIAIEVDTLVQQWNDANRKLILVGMQTFNLELNKLLEQLAEDDSVVVLTETTSNLHSPRFFNKIDSILFPMNDNELKELKPELLLTIGQNVISKKVKSFLRTHQPDRHWHLDSYWQPDTYQCLIDTIKLNPVEFLQKFVSSVSATTSNYFEVWNELREKRNLHHHKYLEKSSFSDLKAFDLIVSSIPENWQIQYSNSSAIRYAQLFDHHSSNEIFCNRGTSGIDGSTSSAIGAAMVNNTPTVLVTGDVGFFYDSNALWNNYIPDNFRIILINNGGGNIFKIIQGPDKTGVVEKVFETKHHLQASYLAEMFGITYQSIKDLTSLNQALNSFFENSEKPKLLEIDTRNVENAEILKDYFKNL